MHPLEARLNKRREIGNLRKLSPANSLIDFASNDYLGLARSRALFHEMQRCWESQYQNHASLGATGSRLLTGNSQQIEMLENQIATFYGFKAGLLFGNGYMANVGLLSAIATSHDAIIFDAEIHASMRDGFRLSRAVSYPFRHNQLDHLKKRLQQVHSAKMRFICIESVYSTDGSLAPLKDICTLAREFEAQVIVDEAHSVGMLGPHGKGLIAREEQTDHIFAMIATFGKALGVYGAIVLGNDLLKETLINFASSAIYTTAMPYYSLAAIQSSYNLFPSLENERLQVSKLINTFRKKQANASHTHIQTLPIPGNHPARMLSLELAKRGFDARPLLSPTVRRNQECLRICLHAFNTVEQVDHLLKIFNSQGSR